MILINIYIITELEVFHAMNFEWLEEVALEIVPEVLYGVEPLKRHLLNVILIQKLAITLQLDQNFKNR